MPPTPYSHELILDVLRAALDNILLDAPFLAGFVVPVAPDSPWSKVAGPYNRTAVDILGYTDLCNKMDFATWRAERFDMYTFLRAHPFELLAPFTLPAPVICANIAFMAGGAALTLAFHHSAMDATGVARVWAAWAAACRGTTLDGGLTLLPRYHPSPGQTGHPALHPAYTFEDSASVMHNTVTSRVRFTDAALYRLKAVASDSTERDTWISTHDALAVLIWAAVGRSTGRRDNLALAVNVNTRARLDPPLSVSYVGNSIYASIVPAPHPGSLPGAARAVRAAIAAVDSARLADFAAFVADAGIRGQRVNEAHARFSLGGPVLVTSSAHMDVLDLDWGPVFGGPRAEYFLIPKQVRTGIVVVLPKDPNGLDIMLGLEQQHMDAFLRDEELTKYASWESGYKPDRNVKSAQ